MQSIIYSIIGSETDPYMMTFCFLAFLIILELFTVIVSTLGGFKK